LLLGKTYLAPGGNGRGTNCFFGGGFGMGFGLIGSTGFGLIGSTGFGLIGVPGVIGFMGQSEV